MPSTTEYEDERLEKVTKYRQLNYESRERHPKQKIMILPLVIGVLGGGIRQVMLDMGKFFEKKTF